MNNRKKSFIGMIIFILGVVALSALFSFATLNTRNMPDYFNYPKTAKGHKLYNKVSSFDFENNYPASPSGVMSLYNDMFCLIYGDIIVDEDMLSETVTLSRKLCSSEILEQNEPASQVENVKASIAELKEKNVYCISAKQESLVYVDADKNNCIINVTIFCNQQSNLYRSYYLQKDGNDGNWKIVRWELTDEHFES